MTPWRRLLHASRPLLLLLPLLVPWFLPLSSLPPGLAFAMTSGRWLFLLAALASAVVLARHPSGSSLLALPRSLFVVCWSSAFLLFLALVPSHRWSGASLTGDEPKYLRMAASLYRDLDVDMASETQQGLDGRLLLRNLRTFAEATRRALADLSSPDDGAAARSTGHNWTIEGRRGGRYYVQSPGLPALLMPVVVLQGGTTPPTLPMVLLAVLWATAAAHAVKLCLELGSSPARALFAVSVAMLSVPALIGGMHFYPESAALPAIAWIVRFVRPGGPPPGPLRSIFLGATIGALPWLHPKLVPVMAVLAVLLVARLRTQARTLVTALAAVLVPALSLLLFQHHVTGMARPDALYLVYASDVYAGLASLLSPRLLTGLVNGLFAARDGLLVMCPVLIAAVLALPAGWAAARRPAFALGAVLAAIWLVAAVHEGGAPGPPARLMAPAIPLLAASLAIGLDQRGSSLPLRWTAAALALATLAMTASFRSDWLRTTNPYRQLPAETNFAPDLPDGPRDLVSVPPDARRIPDLLRGLLLAATLGAWSFILFRQKTEDGPDPWPAILRTHLAWWSSIAGLSFALHALGP